MTDLPASAAPAAPALAAAALAVPAYGPPTAAPAVPTRALWLTGAEPGPGPLDAFLDALRASGDPAADDDARGIGRAGLGRQARAFFAALAPDPMMSGTAVTPALPVALRRMEADPQFAPLVAHLRTRLRLCPTCDGVHRPAWIDRARVLAGQRAFMTRMLPSVLVLLCKSLPEGYAAPGMAEVLNLSGELARRPYHRLMGTLQLLVTVCTPGSFEGPHFPAFVAAEQMRLLHASIRSVVAPRATEPVRMPVEWEGEGLAGPEYEVWPGYAAFVAGGAGRAPRLPINHEDMLGTIIGFSLLVVDGLEELGIPFTPAEAAAYYEVWRTFGVLMGIHPPGHVDEPGYFPPDLEAARAMYAAYKRRNYVGPEQVRAANRAPARAANPAGYALASSHVHMLGHLLQHATRTTWIPESWWTRVPRFYVRTLAGEAGYARLGLPDDGVHGLLRLVLLRLPRAWARLFRRTDSVVHAALSRWLLSALVAEVYGGPVAYPVPDTLDDLRAFVRAAPGRAPVQ